MRILKPYQKRIFNPYPMRAFKDMPLDIFITFRKKGSQAVFLRVAVTCDFRINACPENTEHYNDHIGVKTLT